MDHSNAGGYRNIEGFPELGPLGGADARCLLGELAGPSALDADPEGAAALLAMLGGVPRHLEIAGRLIRRGRFLRPADVARDWCQRGEIRTA